MKNLKAFLGFGIFGYLFLLIFKAGLLYHMEEYSLFSFSREYLSGFFEQPGGLLHLSGAFLTQFCGFPALGALLIAILLCLLALTSGKAFGLEKGESTLSFIPSVFLLLFITGMDWSVYIIKTYGLLFSQILGFTASAGITLFYRRFLSRSRFGWAFSALVVTVGYPLIGVYAHFAALLIIISSSAEGRLDWKLIASAAVTAVAVPLLCSDLPEVYSRINRKYVFLMGAPYMEFTGSFLCQVPLILTALSMALMAFKIKTGKTVRYSTVSASLLVMLVLTNWNPNFRSVLKMERAAAGLDWDKVLSVAGKGSKPTAAEILYRNIALYNKGKLTEDMFKYAPEFERQRPFGQIPLAYVCAAPILYNCGMLNTSDRFSMEISSTFTKNLFFYKHQARTALISGENALARKYLDIISGNWFQGKWVRRYSSFLGDEESLEADKEFSSILPLLECRNDRFDTVDDLQMMILSRYHSSGYINEAVYEWQMASLLMTRDAKGTIYGLFNRNELFPDSMVSTGIAEGAALFASQMADPDLMRELASVLSSKQSVLRRFGGFSRAFNSVAGELSAETAGRFRKDYGDTYWFYYFFGNDIER